MAIRFSVFKTQKPKQFNYKPLYYDPAKEELMQRVNAIKKQQAAEKDETEVVREARMSKAFQDRRNTRQKSDSGIMQNQTFRILVIATILAAIAYYLLR
jgi:N-acetylmuramoyl-L-alanine amidase